LCSQQRHHHHHHYQPSSTFALMLLRRIALASQHLRDACSIAISLIVVGGWDVL
jgi:hypothetical protein